MRARGALLLAAVLLTTGLAGCLAGEDDDLQANESELSSAGLAQVVDAEGQPLAYAQVTQLDEAGDTLALGSATAEGIILETDLEPGVGRLVVTAPGHETWRGDLDQLPATLELAEEPAPTTAQSDADTLAFLEPLTMGAAYLGDRPETCAAYNCGASEPVIELASDGTIYVSGTCCVGESPPIWYSTDGGNSFQLLRGDALRDNFGIEGDFAIDEAGNLYFSDISVANAYLASWTAEQEHRWTIPAGPFVPPVDRPWIRAGPEDQAWFLYNQVTSTLLYESTDGGLTWTLVHEFPGALGNFNRGPGISELWVTADDHLWHSDVGGKNVEDLGEIPRPTDEGNKFQAYDVVAIDQIGNVWVVYDWTNGTSEAYHVYATPYRDGGFGEPVRISPDEGTHHLPWAAAGAEGNLALAWYGTLDDEAGPNDVAEDAKWELFSAATLDGTRSQPSFQLAKPDPQFVHEGPMNRKLLDFLQVEIGPEGAVHIAYAQDREGQPDERTEYVRSTTGLDLAREDYLNGP